MFCSKLLLSTLRRMFCTVPHSVPASSGIELPETFSYILTFSYIVNRLSNHSLFPPVEKSARFNPVVSHSPASGDHPDEDVGQGVLGILAQPAQPVQEALPSAVLLPHRGSSNPGPPRPCLTPDRLQLVLVLRQLLLVQPGLAGHAEARVRR